MTITNIRNVRKQWFIILSPAIVALTALATTPINGVEPKVENPMNAFNDILSQDASTRDRVVDTFLRDRKSLIDRVIPIVDPANSKKYTDEARCAAAYVLGEMRALEAVPVLAKALADPPGRIVFPSYSRYDAPIFEALVKIGRPAVPAMIENIKTSDGNTLRKNSMDVLVHVLGGKRRLMELLGKLSDNALAEQPPDSKASERFKKARSWADDHYKEDKEPLY